MLGMVGLVEEADRAMTQWFRADGDAIVLLGKTRDDLGGSEYLKVLQHREQGSPPLLNLETEGALHKFVLNVIHEGSIQSAHDCSDGGLAVALAECCVSGPDASRGAVVKLELGSLRRDALLFGESQSRIILSTRRDVLDSLLTRAAQAGVPAAHIGTVGGDRLVIDVEGGKHSDGCRIDLPIENVRDRWAHAIEERLTQE
jgi:phosphoribosylformylglycinamidine synthase